jgi:hypothetical protein
MRLPRSIDDATHKKRQDFFQDLVDRTPRIDGLASHCRTTIKRMRQKLYDKDFNIGLRRCGRRVIHPTPAILRSLLPSQTAHIRCKHAAESRASPGMRPPCDACSSIWKATVRVTPAMSQCRPSSVSMRSVLTSASWIDDAPPPQPEARST